MKSYLLVASLIGLVSTQINAQTCYDGASETTPSSRFTINENGTISDLSTGLMWQRCNYGQTYNSESNECAGNSVQLTWAEALRGAANSELAGSKGWQVPNIKELASIVEHKCVEPSINIELFINTQHANYWTSTTEISNSEYAWVYYFDTGSNELASKQESNFLRLVRYEK